MQNNGGSQRDNALAVVDVLRRRSGCANSWENCGEQARKHKREQLNKEIRAALTRQKKVRGIDEKEFEKRTMVVHKFLTVVACDA